jgi:CheY-like chemotaxis protein
MAVLPGPSARGEMAKMILVADDNPSIRKMLCEMFEVEEDYDICAEAANGQEAIDLAVKHRPDLIILDLSMPVMNGLEAARKLKEIMPEVPIILFTDHAYFSHDLLFGAEQPFDRVLSKMDAKELIRNVKSLVPV